MDEVVLLSPEGDEIGRAPKAAVHGADTPLHLAFSCYLHDEAGRILVTRRSLEKRSWPGVWTNSFCGHPGPGEPVVDAVRRHAQGELGIQIADLTLELPLFRYRAVDPAGVVEHEICPVYVAYTDDEPRLNPDEVAEARWVDPADLDASLTTTPWAFSPWLVLQAQQLELFAPHEQRRAS